MRPVLALCLGGIVALFAALSVGSMAALAAQDLPPGPTSLAPLSRLHVDSDALRSEEAQMLILDFSPGRWTPRHSHAGLTLVRVLEGEMTVRHDDGDLVFGPGEGWIEQPGDVHAAGNVGTELAKVQVTFVLPSGAPLTTIEGTPSDAAPPGPTTAFQSRRVQLAEPDLAFDEAATTMRGFSPGAWTPQHSHAGLTLVGVLDGDMTVRNGEQESVYTQGDLWIEQPGNVHAAGNTTPADASVAVTFLQRRGQPVTTVAAAQAPVQEPRAMRPTGDEADTVGRVVVGGIVAVVVTAVRLRGGARRERASV
jgi:quercetin dioxygenase-like cupin family protein